ncbi:unnamed protein product [Cuscuta epithymum]|uniref:Protein kinase domain-containing protein n=1 Tax=Cuscuta epithymum TaxID=186058 RepID=A0AAV0FWK9_9ASTE|nr:unnamed protein product [Cuscuta epithymum]
MSFSSFSTIMVYTVIVTCSSMEARLRFTCFMILCHIFLNSHLTEAMNRTPNEDCPKSDFHCGILGKVGYPFFPESSRPDCGLSRLDCSAKPYPKLDLYGKEYDVIEKESLFLRLIDRDLENLLSKKSCDTFYHNFSLPYSPAISYEVYHNLTLFRCNIVKDRSQNESINGHFHDFLRYDKCSSFETGGFVVFYKKPYEDQDFGYIADHDFDQAGCSRIQLPIPLSSEVMPNGEGPFGLVNATFLLEWSLSEDCIECHDRGGLCIVDQTNRYHCSKGTDMGTVAGKVDHDLLLEAGGVALAVGVLLGIILVVVIYKRKRHKSLYDISRSKSSKGESSKDYGVPIFTHKELDKATDHFASSRELGDGGFGTVYYGKLQDGREVAVKYLYQQNRKRKEQFINEIQILAGIRHPNLVTLYGCTSKHSRELLLVYEYIPNGTLSDHLHGRMISNGDPPLNWPIRMNIAVETARALAYLHASDIIHRDIKTANILLTHNFSVKVADFGLSRLFPNDVTHVSTGPQGTPGYVDPEYHKCYHLTDKSDVYSFGVVLIELISSMPAVDVDRGKDEINLSDLAMKRMLRGEMNRLVDKSLGFETDEVVTRMTSSVAELGFQCLQLDKELRPAMEEVLLRLLEIQGDNIEASNVDKSADITRNSSDSGCFMLQEVLVSPDSVMQKWVSTKYSV